MLTANEFIKKFKRTFKNAEFRATSKEGKVYKSKGFDKLNKQFDK
tara:strand:+ start:1245 stop:1379 length:135 start_codon:yes stop_codon:yes gene_type:complete